MGTVERVSRRKVVDVAQQSLDKVKECVSAVNQTAARAEDLGQEIAKVRLEVGQLRTDVLTSRRALDDRLTAQGQMVEAIEREHAPGLGFTPSAHDKAVLAYSSTQALERLTFLGRLRWLLTGRLA